MSLHEDYRKLLSKARSATNRNPSQSQIERDAYAKGKLKIHGLEIAIENPKGSTRRGVDDDGNEWESKMFADYGELVRQRGADGDPIDVFIGPYPESEVVVVVNQVDPKTRRFDEHKVILGTTCQEEAEKLYMRHYESGWRGLGDSKIMLVSDFKKWLRGDTTKRAEELWPELSDVFSFAEKTAAELRIPADVFQHAMASFPTTTPVGIFMHARTKQAGYGPEYSQLPVDEQQNLGDYLLSTAVRPKVAIDLDDHAWVKVAYSPWVRRLGEMGHFFPTGTGSTGPVQSMIVSGLLGAGAGYAGGYLGSQFLPEDYDKKKFRRSMLLGGALAGATPGLLWGVTNKSIGKKFNDPSLLMGETENFKKSSTDLGHYVAQAEWFEKCAAEWNSEVLDVDINSLGQLLWDVGATPDVAAQTMGAMYAAERMPGGRGPGKVTPAQVGHLAMNMGGGYIAGAMAGKSLGQLVGMPKRTQNALKTTGLALGVVKTVLPKIFGG